ncbi:MAG TPA: hypothetical protein G4O01_09180 [Dehalococcoidia bacterium]|jgi:hypothetical protein|nr:hypothetical protein [Dehalococcoidia bacterium]
MGVAKELYQLQEVDLEIEAEERALNGMLSQLGDDSLLTQARNKLAAAERQLEELKRHQHEVEWEIDDLVSKITALEEELYSGRIKNPKELSSLQHEVEILKGKRGQLENEALEVMEQVETAGASIASGRRELEAQEAEWQRRQQQLSAEIESLKGKLANLKQKRERCLAGISPQVVEVYERLRKHKGQAVVKVERGICRGCRISLPFGELQQARSGNLVQCSSCGRILFLP